MSCTLMCTWSVAFWTLPSKIFATPSWRAISDKFPGLAAYCCVEVRAITLSAPIFASRQCRSHRSARNENECCHNRAEHEQCDCRFRPADVGTTLLQRLELFWQLRIAHLICVEVHDRDAHSVFHFAFAETV